MIDSFYTQPFPTIDIDSRFLLRAPTADDTEDFFAYYSDPEVTRHILARTPRNLTEAGIDMYHCKSIFQKKEGIFWSLIQKKDQKMVGAIGLYIANTHHRGEICYDLSRSLWNRGIMTQVLKKVIAFCFNEIGLVRIEASILKENLASTALLSKLNFQREGTLRNYRHFESEFYDIEMYALTANSLRQKKR